MSGSVARCPGRIWKRLGTGQALVTPAGALIAGALGLGLHSVHLHGLDGQSFSAREAELEAHPSAILQTTPPAILQGLSPPQCPLEACQGTLFHLRVPLGTTTSFLPNTSLL